MIFFQRVVNFSKMFVWGDVITIINTRAQDKSSHQCLLVLIYYSGESFDIIFMRTKPRLLVTVLLLFLDHSLIEFIILLKIPGYFCCCFTSYKLYPVLQINCFYSVKTHHPGSLCICRKSIRTFNLFVPHHKQNSEIMWFPTNNKQQIKHTFLPIKNENLAN